MDGSPDSHAVTHKYLKKCCARRLYAVEGTTVVQPGSISRMSFRASEAGACVPILVRARARHNFGTGARGRVDRKVPLIFALRARKSNQCSHCDGDLAARPGREIPALLEKR